MILWIIAGILVWILCVSFMLVIIKGGHRVRGNRYEQKLYYRNMAKMQKFNDLTKGKKKKATRVIKNHGLLVSEIA